MIVEPSEVDIGTRRERDRALVEAHCNGDPDAFASIVGDHYGSLLAQAQRRVRSRGEAEDVVQDTFERAFRAICRFGADDDYRLGAWLSRILANVCNDRGGRIAREAGISERLAADGADGTEAFETVSDPFVLSVVHDAIDALPASQRDTFLLKERDGLTYPQVADRLEITEENARARVHRARAALQRSLSLTRGMLGGIVAMPLGFRTLLRRARGYSPAVPTSPEAGTAGAPSALAVQVAANPVVQAVATIAPSGAVRGSAIAAIGLAITGAIGIPVVADSTSSAPPVQVVAAPAEAPSVASVPTPTPTAAPTLTPTSTTTGSAAPSPAATSTGAKGLTDAAVAQLQAANWWEIFGFALPGALDTENAATPGTAPVGAVPQVACTSAPADGDVVASAVTPVVSQINLAPVATTGSIDGELRLATTAPFGAGIGSGDSGETLAVRSTACASPFPGAVDITLSSGAKSVHLVGALVYSNAGTYVYRGTATTSAASMPWGTRVTFMARLTVANAPATAQLSLVFFEDVDAASVPQGTPRDIVVSPPAKAPGEDHSGAPTPTTTTSPVSAPSVPGSGDDTNTAPPGSTSGNAPTG